MEQKTYKEYLEIWEEDKTKEVANESTDEEDE